MGAREGLVYLRMRHIWNSGTNGYPQFHRIDSSWESALLTPSNVNNLDNTGSGVNIQYVQVIDKKVTGFLLEVRLNEDD